MSEVARRILVLGLVILIAPTALGGEPAPVAETPGLRATQVSVAIRKGETTRRFRATVMARTDETLTLLTAAHCLTLEDRGGPASLILDGGEVMEGSVESVALNPSYRVNDGREVPGPDNAVARLRFEPGRRGEGSAFGAIRPAPGVVARPYPGPGGRRSPSG